MGRAWKQESGHQSSSTCFAPTCCGILSKSCPTLELYPPVKHNCHLELDTCNSASSSSFSGSIFFKPYTVKHISVRTCTDILYPHVESQWINMNSRGFLFFGSIRKASLLGHVLPGHRCMRILTLHAHVQEEDGPELTKGPGKKPTSHLSDFGNVLSDA